MIYVILSYIGMLGFIIWHIKTKKKETKDQLIILSFGLAISPFLPPTILIQLIYRKIKEWVI